MTDNFAGIDRAALSDLVDHIEALESDKASIAADIKQHYDAGKAQGLDPKIVRALVRERKQTRQEREDFAAALDAYRAALGDFADTELGQASAPRGK